MTAPSYLTAFPAMLALYEDLAVAFAASPFAPHADNLAYRAVMHASAWLSADLPETPFHATENQGVILYLKTYDEKGVPALDAHLAALWNDHTLTPAGLALYAELNEPEKHPRGIAHSYATSLWLNHLRLLTQYGLDFDQRFKSAHDAA
jgi:hypothetical protein